MFLPILALSCRDKASDTASSSPAESEAKLACPVHSCASRPLSVEEGIACCIDAEGMDIARALDIASEFNQPGSCEDDEVYDTSILSAEAAICAAQVQGLSPGISTCDATFGMSECQPRWYVWNYVVDPCTPGEDSDGRSEGLALDAVTGITTSEFEMYSTPLECPE